MARQYQNEGVDFLPATVAASARLPRSLFDSVADNLIRNALAKRAEQPSVRVQASFDGGTALSLRVRDTGTAVPEDLAAGLLRAPGLPAGPARPPRRLRPPGLPRWRGRCRVHRR